RALLAERLLHELNEPFAGLQRRRLPLLVLDQLIDDGMRRADEDEDRLAVRSGDRVRRPGDRQRHAGRFEAEARRQIDDPVGAVTFRAEEHVDAIRDQVVVGVGERALTNSADASADEAITPLTARNCLTSSAILSIVGLFWSQTYGRCPASITAAAPSPASSPPITATAGLPASVNAVTRPSPAFSPAAPMDSAVTSARASDLAPTKIVGPTVRLKSDPTGEAVVMSTAEAVVTCTAEAVV